MLLHMGRFSSSWGRRLAFLAFTVGAVPASSVPTAVETEEAPKHVHAGVGVAAAGGGACGAGPARAAGSTDLEFRAAPMGTIELAWFAPAVSMADRVSRTRRASLELGAWNLDSVARVAMRSGEGERVEQAAAAVQLAPDLPIAHIALAEALWLNGDSPIGALRSAASSIAAIPRHAEAGVWFAGSALYLLAFALLVGGLLCVGIVGLFVAPHAAHDLGDAVSGSLPAFARVALLLSVLLVPLLLGEGIFGLAIALLAVTCAYSGSFGRAAMVVAAGAIVAGAFPVAKLAGTVLTALPGDPVLRAALAIGQGFTHPVDLARLEAASGRDSLAVRGLAQGAQSHGNLGVADTHYQVLLMEEPDDPTISNNAAGVRLELGHMQAALDLYADSIAMKEAPLALFNLSQAYGRAFQVEELSRTLARAQQLDGEMVAKLAQLQGAEAEGFVVALPLGLDRVWKRVLSSGGGEPIAAEFRTFFAPGLLGTTVEVAALAFALAAFAGSLVGWRIHASRLCPRCGRRICPRCDDDEAEKAGETCMDCVRLFRQTENTDRIRRIERINALRKRAQRLDKATWIASILIPGAAGALAGKPVRSLVGTLCFSLALASVYWRGGVVPDPLVAGDSAPLVFLMIAILAGLGYAVSVAISLPSERET